MPWRKLAASKRAGQPRSLIEIWPRQGAVRQLDCRRCRRSANLMATSETIGARVE